jgi:uncharacterized protein YdaL
VFYFGTTYSNALPEAFLADVRLTANPFCWFKYNLWELVGPQTNAFVERFGFRFDYMDASGFDTVVYRGETFLNHSEDPDVGRVTPLDPERVQTPALIQRAGDTAGAIPYAVRSGGFWYLADSPFSFITEEDRYLVFCDLLHDILEIDHPSNRRALLRLEDIDPNYPPERLAELAAVLRQEALPFVLNVIPVFEDPFGLFSEGVPRRLTWSDRPEALASLQSLVAAGGQIALHGYTHQYGNQLNPWTGLSGDDYEFYRVQVDDQGEVTTFEPLPEDSPVWVRARLDAARAELGRVGLSAAAWSTPHYAASALAYQIFADQFDLTTQRVLYHNAAGRSAGQFFPYWIERDVYGQRVAPENLGNLQPDPVSGQAARSVDDILRAARKNLAVRDGWASAFFHPFLDLEELRRLIRGIRTLGFDFVPLATETAPNVVLQSPDQHHWPGARVVLAVQSVGAGPLQYQWRLNGSAVTGATNDTLVLAELQAHHLGQYTVEVSGPLGSVVSYPIGVRFLVQPVILSAAVTNHQFLIRFEAAEGLRYYVDYRDSVNATSWTATFPLTGGGATTNMPAPVGGLGQRYYRLRVN